MDCRDSQRQLIRYLCKCRECQRVAGGSGGVVGFAITGTLRDNHANTEFPHYLWGWAVGSSPSHTHTYSQRESQRVRASKVSSVWTVEGTELSQYVDNLDLWSEELTAFTQQPFSSDITLKVESFTVWKLLTIKCINQDRCTTIFLIQDLG